MRGRYGRVNGHHQNPRSVCWCEWIKPGNISQHGSSDEGAVRAQGLGNEGIRSEDAGESCQQDRSSEADIRRKHVQLRKAEEEQRMVCETEKRVLAVDWMRG